MNNFQPDQIPQARRVLIEASAGTGKTYNIAAIFLHFILTGAKIQEVLVVTFTEAATKELRDRLHQRLAACSRALHRVKLARRAKPDAWLDELGGGDDAGVLAMVASSSGLAEGVIPESGLLARVLERVDRALVDFDAAPIFTIHGFCSQVQNRHALECGIPFQRELVDGDVTMPPHVLREYIRRWWYSPGNPDIEVLISGKLGYLERLVRYAVRSPGLLENCARRLGETLEPGLATAVGQLRDALGDGQGLTPDQLHAIALAWMAEYGGDAEAGAGVDFSARCADILADPEYQLEGELRGFLGRLAYPDEERGKGRAKKSAGAKSGKGGKGGKGDPEGEDRPAPGCLLEIFLIQHAALILPAAIAALKEENNWMTFDDMIAQVAGILEQDGPTAQLLLANLRKTYRVALVDEFQDTDKLQYAIFQKVFGESGDSHQLFMIGDPKQSIYAFRGADLEAYLRAREGAEQYSLARNFRTAAALGECFNEFYAASGEPFLDERIAYSEILYREQSAKTGELGECDIERGEEGEFEVEPWEFGRLVLDACDRGTPGKEELGMEAWQALRTARQVRDLLMSPAVLTPGGKPRRLKCSDIAILTRTNAQIGEIRQALAKLGIHSVSRKSEDVIESREARAMQTLMEAMLVPSERLVRQIFAGPLFDRGWEGVSAMGSEAIIAFAQQLRECGQIWRQAGILKAISAFLAGNGFPGECVRGEFAERTIVNVAQMQEILHEREVAGHCTPEQLLSWLTQARAGNDGDDTGVTGARQQRLESDRDAVELVTIHGAKGLEYPVVFVPFFTGKIDRRAQTGLFSVTDSETGEEVLVTGLETASDKFHEMVQRRNREEAARLLYVALTRASQLCVVSLASESGPRKGDTIAGSVYALHFGVDPEDKEAGRGALMQRVNELDGRGGILVLDGEDWYLPKADEPNPSLQSEAGALPEVRTLSTTRFVPRNTMTSFTSLTRFAHDKGAHAPDPAAAMANPDAPAEPELPAAVTGGLAVEADAAVESGKWPDPRLAGLRGATFGVLVHEIFELLTPDEARSGGAGDLRACVQRSWEAHATPEMARDAVETAIATLQAQQPASPLLARLLEVRGDAGASEAICVEAIQDLVYATLRTPLPGLGVSLGEVDWEMSRAEMEFYIPVGQISIPRFAEALARRQSDIRQPHPVVWRDYAEKLAAAGSQEITGFLNGKIDMTFIHEGRFYVIDWKTNNLARQLAMGSSVSEAVYAEMADAHYLLQYHIYLLALDRHFRQVWPGYDYASHFGGVIYPFVRFVGSRGSDAFYIDRPEFILPGDFRG